MNKEKKDLVLILLMMIMIVLVGWYVWTFNKNIELLASNPCQVCVEKFNYICAGPGPKLG